ncbi:MAG: hypothetical protein ACREC8_00560, partial [Limisphaerales bacterium]
MNKILSVSETLALLEGLKRAIRDFAAREEKLNADFHKSSTTAFNLFEAQDKKLESDFTERLAAAGISLETGKNQCQSRFEERRHRINRAHENIRSRIEHDIQNRDVQWRSEVQNGLVEAEQRRDGELAAAAAAHEKFQQKLSDSEIFFKQLEKNARRAFRVSGKFRRLLRQKRRQPESIPFSGGDEFFAALQQLQTKIESELKQFRKFLLPRFFRFIPFWPLAILLLAFIAANQILPHFGLNIVSTAIASAALIVFLILLAVSFFARRAAAPAASAVANLFLKARGMLNGGFEKIGLHYQQEQQHILAEFENNQQALNQRWKEGTKGLTHWSNTAPAQIDDQAFRLQQKNQQCRLDRLKRLEAEYNETVARLQSEHDAQTKQNSDDYNAKKAKLEKGHQTAWLTLETDWKETLEPLCANLNGARTAAEKLFAEWITANWENWTPPQDFQNAAKFARLEMNVAKFVETLPKDKRLVLPCPATISAPLSLVFPSQGSILFETGKTGSEEAVGAINNIIFRLFATTPPGKLTFTIFDPVGLGQNFASLMHLADYEESYINNRIWTQTDQFEEKLAELNEHMEKIIQMYL